MIAKYRQMPAPTATSAWPLAQRTAHAQLLVRPGTRASRQPLLVSCNAASSRTGSPSTSTCASHCSVPFPTLSSRRRRCLPPVASSSTETGTETEAPPSRARLDQLKATRERALSQLRTLDGQVRDEVVRLQGTGALPSALDGAVYPAEVVAPQATSNPPGLHGAGVAGDLDNFGYIRQFSGEPYDCTKAMGVPGGMLEMGFENFIREGHALLKTLGFTQLPKLLKSDFAAPAPTPSETMQERQRILNSLTLNNQAIWDREHARPQVKSPWIIKGPYLFLCWVLDVLFDNRPIARFWLLETVARMPYFSYINMLHLYESLGWWRRSLQARKVHFAEEWNEAHHLLIMESLGGDQRWSDRFLAQHAAIVYYFALLLMWVASPTLAYNFSELIEAHAVDTYGQFVDENAEVLKTLPPPRVARLYYESDDMYLFNEFQTEREPGTRFVVPRTLYDVFCNIRDDEAEHVATMHAMQNQDVLNRAPNIEYAVAAMVAVVVSINLWLPRTVAGGLETGEGTGVAAESLSWSLETLATALTDLLALLVGL